MDWWEGSSSVMGETVQSALAAKPTSRGSRHGKELSEDTPGTFEIVRPFNSHMSNGIFGANKAQKQKCDTLV